MILVAEFDIEGTPKLINEIGRKSWPIKAREAKLWVNKISGKCHALKISGIKLEKASITYIRHSMKQPDHDNLAISFKHVQDGLVKAQVIIDDTHAVIGVPTYLWLFRARRLGGLTTVKIERPDDV
jgi:hypothetical protein